ncbi:MAG TPA: hypothetical protein VEZ15_12960 [Acidimicrobiia bacterium]|nr:hypothetical protein [Acidimicrobiia bacterium]
MSFAMPEKSLVKSAAEMETAAPPALVVEVEFFVLFDELPHATSPKLAMTNVTPTAVRFGDTCISPLLRVGCSRDATVPP